jgi:hypothetical protein
MVQWFSTRNLPLATIPPDGEAHSPRPSFKF